MRCKPGDLAWIIRGPNTGKMVEVLASSFLPGWWECRPLSRNMRNVDSGEVCQGQTGHTRDCDLSPLPKDPDAMNAPDKQEPITA